MSLGDLMIQEYPSGVYQPGTPSPDPKVCLIQPSLEISDSPFPPQRSWPQNSSSLQVRLVWTSLFYMIPSSLLFTSPKSLQRPPYLTNFLWTTSKTYMWQPYTTRSLHSPQLLSSFYGTNKNVLDPHLWHLPFPGDIHLHSPPLINTDPSLTKTAPSYILPTTIVKFFPLQPLRNLHFFPKPSRYLTGSIRLKPTMHNMIKTATLVSSLLPFHVKITNHNLCTLICSIPSYQEYQWQHLPLLFVPFL